MGNAMIGWFRLGVFLSAAVVSASAVAQGRIAALDNALILNEDDSHFFGSRETRGHDAGTGSNAFVDQYAGSAVTHLFLCPNAMRASFRSRTRDAIWDPVEGRIAAGSVAAECQATARRPGSIPYAVWIAAAARRASRPGCRCG